ncbi:MAG: hypothetical protein KAJ19_08310 [Gammaproteobacteria bacterium]|nr:hypothetical protein [Gammaproteobacteria bacterium]
MAELLGSKKVTTRKQHKCFGCDRTFPEGSELVRRKHVEDGCFDTTYWCEVCGVYWITYMQGDDEINQGDLKHNDPEGWEEVRKQTEVPE